MDKLSPVRYRNSDVEVQLGDHVEGRVWFQKYKGRVVYVPDISPPNVEFEQYGLSYVGIRLTDGCTVATLVDPKTRHLVKKVTFLNRGERDFQEIRPTDRPFAEGGEGLSP